MDHDVAVAGHVGGDDGESGAHRFDEGQGQAFLLRCGEEGDARKPAAQQLERGQEHLEPLDRVEATDASEHHIIRGQRQAVAADRRFGHRLAYLLRSDAVDDHRVLLGLEEPEAEPLDALGGGHVDDRATEARKLTLERQIEPLAYGGVVGVVNAMEGMDGRRLGPPGGQAAVEAWPFAVGVDDRNVELTDQADGQQQVAEAQTAPRELQDSEPERLEALKENPVARPSDHHVELAFGKLADEVIDVLRSAAGSGGGQ